METPSAPYDGAAVVLPPGVRPLVPADPAEIGGHPLAGRLGAGGMGVVYLAHDRRGGLVAVKAAYVDTAGDEDVGRRFRAEVACMRRAPASYTARLLADGTDRTPPYIITEYVEGRSLEQIVDRDGPLAPEQLRALATGTARALAAIHEAGLVHRDLKPANILLTPAGPRVIDFGIAQEVPAAGGLTGRGVVMGSPGWIAPERLTRSPATPAADVFGWGCLIGYAGTGRNPFGDGDTDEVALRTINDAPDLDGLDESLRPPVEAALAKEPADRPDAGELLALLSTTGPFGGTGPRIRWDESRESATPARARRGRRVAALASLAAVLAAVLIAAWIVTGAGPAAPPTSDDVTAVQSPVAGRTGGPPAKNRPRRPAHGRTRLAPVTGRSQAARSPRPRSSSTPEPTASAVAGTPTWTTKGKAKGHTKRGQGG